MILFLAATTTNDIRDDENVYVLTEFEGVCRAYGPTADAPCFQLWGALQSAKDLLPEEDQDWANTQDWEILSPIHPYTV